jgi:hypothetical protein
MQPQGGGGMGGMGALAMMMMSGGMGGMFGNQAPEDNRTRGEMVTDAAKSTWDVTKQAPAWIGENLNPGAMVRDAVNPTGVWDGAKQMWNSKPGDGQFGAGAMQAGLGAIAPTLAARGAWNGARAAAPGFWNGAKGLISGAAKGIGIPTAAGGTGMGIKALGQGLKSGVGMGIGKTVGGLGLGMNLYDEAAGNTDYSGDGSWGDLAWGGLRAMGNNLSAAASGAQTAGPVGAVWGAGAHLATGLGRGAYDIGKAWSDGAEAEAGADKWKARTDYANKLRSSMSPEAWKAHVDTQRKAGKHSWDPPAATPQATPVPATPTPTVPTPAVPAPAGPTPSAAVKPSAATAGTKDAPPPK